MLISLTNVFKMHIYLRFKETEKLDQRAISFVVFHGRNLKASSIYVRF